MSAFMDGRLTRAGRFVGGTQTLRMEAIQASYGSMTKPCCDRMAYDLNQKCELHADRAACPDAMIAEVRGGFALYVRDGEEGYGGSVIEIAYCPWCGTKLPPIDEIDLSTLPPEDFS